jgi:glutamate synthase (NADPH/NADH) large chain
MLPSSSSSITSSSSSPLGFPPSCGLYSPSYERSSCGVGFVATLTGESSHQIIRDGLEILHRLAHRGACGCEENSGDGAGILTCIPHKFFTRVMKEQGGKTLPKQGNYAVGNIFFSRDYEERQLMKREVEKNLSLFGLSLLCWRSVPVDNHLIGNSALSTEPNMEQLFIEKDEEWSDQQFSLRLFCFRISLTSPTFPVGRLYVCSLSAAFIVYKGQLTPDQLVNYFVDLGQKDYESSFSLVHSRFSTNTFPTWERAQPLRMIAHNGEINTLKGNWNWNQSREAFMKSSKLNEQEMNKLFPVLENGTSDSGAFDNLLEFLSTVGDHSLESSMLLMMPLPWRDRLLELKSRELFEFYSHKMEPWDGPALVVFTDGKKLGAVLDRNGLRPGRIYELQDGRVMLASEVGVLPELDAASIKSKSRLAPGEMFLVDFQLKRIIPDKEIKQKLSASAPFGEWLRIHQIDLVDLTKAGEVGTTNEERIQELNKRTLLGQAFPGFPMEVPSIKLSERLRLFGFTSETIELLVGPMSINGSEPLGSMGNDTALACLSSRPRLLYDYFQQNFAQVTNPAIDPIRESFVMA